AQFSRRATIAHEADPRTAGLPAQHFGQFGPPPELGGVELDLGRADAPATGLGAGPRQGVPRLPQAGLGVAPGNTNQVVPFPPPPPPRAPPRPRVRPRPPPPPVRRRLPAGKPRRPADHPHLPRVARPRKQPPPPPPGRAGAGAKRPPRAPAKAAALPPKPDHPP